MNVVIIEDEHLAAQKLMRLLEELEHKIEVIQVLESVEQSLNWLSIHDHPDLVFMDIQLDDGLCFEIFEHTRLLTPVIFTTAFDEYTLQAFKVNSIDYLLKPIKREELKAALDKFKSIHRKELDLAVIQSILSPDPPVKERFLVKIGEHFKSISTHEIVCFYIEERCTFIHTNSGKKYIVDESLDRINKVIDTRLFFRANRTTIVNFHAIEDILAYSSSRLRLTISHWEGEPIIVSRERVVDFKRWADR